MLAAIDRSLAAYASGIRCWAAFQDACNNQIHFPATESGVIRYAALFRSAGTLGTYLKQLRWAHRFLHMRNDWHTDVVRQVGRGRRKLSALPRTKLALQSTAVQKLVAQAEAAGDQEQAAILAVSRLFLLRVPSECLPLQIQGEHSEVQVDGEELVITLSRRKPSRRPSVLRRSCCCSRAGRRLCGLHQLLPMIDRARMAGTNRLFTKSPADFVACLRRDAAAVGIPEAGLLGSHALRRGMARDIVDAGGSLATLLRAGEWRSGAFAAYLRDHQVEDCAVAQLLVDHSDSE